MSARTWTPAAAGESLEHQTLLSRALNCDLSIAEREAFEDMLRTIASPESRYKTLSKKQEEWARRTLLKHEPEPTRLTDGAVPRGREVSIPEVLKKPLPLKPPGRK